MSTLRRARWTYLQNSAKQATIGPIVLPKFDGHRPPHSHRSKDILGCVYEYFLAPFTSAQGKGGQFYPGRGVVRYKGRIYVPCRVTFGRGLTRVQDSSNTPL